MLFVCLFYTMLEVLLIKSRFCVFNHPDFAVCDLDKMVNVDLYWVITHVL